MALDLVLKQQALISHASGVWKAKVKAPGSSVPGGTYPLLCPWPSSCFALTWWRTEGSKLCEVSFIRALLERMGAPSSTSQTASCLVASCCALGLNRRIWRGRSIQSPAAAYVAAALGGRKAQEIRWAAGGWGWGAHAALCTLTRAPQTAHGPPISECYGT